MTRVAASHLPPAFASLHQSVVLEQDDVQVHAVDLTADIVDRVCGALLAAQARLADMPVARVIRAVDAVARRLLDAHEPERTSVLHSLRAVSGLSGAMASYTLERAAQDWLAPSLEELLHAEFGGPDAVESFAPLGAGRRARAIAPPLGLHIFAGNVPGVGVTSIVRALLVRSAVLGKSASAEPALAPAFARLLTDVDADIAACVAVTYWPGGNIAIEDAAIARAGLVVHYGGRDATADLRSRIPPHVRFVEHGPRISFALVDASSAGPIANAPHDLARAVAIFDQQGCVSPQIAYIIGSAQAAREFADATARELALVQTELPRGRLLTGEAAAIRDMRTRAEFRIIAGSDGEIWAPPALDYTVILSDTPDFEGTCLNRTLIIKHVPDLDTLERVLAPFANLLQTTGVAGMSGRRLTDTANRLARVGVSRITTIAAMPWPPPAWHHDGRGPLRELVQWVDLEDS